MVTPISHSAARIGPLRFVGSLSHPPESCAPSTPCAPRLCSRLRTLSSPSPPAAASAVQPRRNRARCAPASHEASLCCRRTALGSGRRTAAGRSQLGALHTFASSECAGGHAAGPAPADRPALRPERRGGPACSPPPLALSETRFSSPLLSTSRTQRRGGRGPPARWRATARTTRVSILTRALAHRLARTSGRDGQPRLDCARHAAGIILVPGVRLCCDHLQDR